METIRLLVADDHNILRQGLVDILRHYKDMVVVAEAESGDEILLKYEKVKPDVVLTDIEMPFTSGINAAKKILQKYPEAKFLFLSMFYNDDYIYKIDSIGGKGLLSKEIIKDELINAIRLVSQGGSYYYGKTEEEIEFIRTRNDLISGKLKYSKSVLTPREKTVLLEIAKGSTSEGIAAALNIGKRTVDACRSSIMSKLNITTLPGLIKYAIEYETGNKK